MTVLRRFLLFCTGLLGLALVAGIVGLLVDPSRANLWTQSLMWALLGSIAVAPFLVFLPSSSPASPSPPSSSSPPFNPEPADTDWPFEQNEEWPTVPSDR